jgi:hypothetical protein
VSRSVRVRDDALRAYRRLDVQARQILTDAVLPAVPHVHPEFRYCTSGLHESATATGRGPAFADPCASLAPLVRARPTPPPADAAAASKSSTCYQPHCNHPRILRFAWSSCSPLQLGLHSAARLLSDEKHHAQPMLFIAFSGTTQRRMARDIINDRVGRLPEPAPPVAPLSQFESFSERLLLSETRAVLCLRLHKTFYLYRHIHKNKHHHGSSCSIVRR